MSDTAEQPKSERTPDGKWVKGTPSPNPSGRVRGTSLAKTLRLLLADDEETWKAALEAENANEGKGEDGKHERVKLALNILRRAKFDTHVLAMLWDRVDGKLPTSLLLPDDDAPTQLFRQVLYVKPEPAPEQPAAAAPAAMVRVTSVAAKPEGPPN